MYTPKTIRFELVDQFEEYPLFVRLFIPKQIFHVDPLKFCFYLNLLAAEKRTEKIVVFFRSKNISITTSYDIAICLRKCVDQGIQIVAYSDQLTLGHLLAMCPCQVRCCPPFAGPLKIAFTLSHFWLESQMAKIGLSVYAGRSSEYKLGAVDFGEKEIPPEVLDWEKSIGKKNLEHIVDFINENAGTKINISEKMTYSTATEAAQDGLLTHVTYEELLDSIDHKISKAKSLASWSVLPFYKRQKFSLPMKNPKLGILELSAQNTSLMAPRKLRNAMNSISEFSNRSEIKGILIVMNHRGGDLSDADRMWSILKEIGKQLPIVVYIKNALSAGYYIASAASRIVVNPLALVGAVGTVIFRPDLSGLLEKIGIRIYSSEVNGLVDSFPYLNPVSEMERLEIQKRVEIGSKLFQSRIAIGRNLARERVIPLANGRIFSAGEALEYNLVDQMGTLLDSLELLQSLSGVNKQISFVRLPGTRNSFLNWLARASWNAIT